MHNFKANYGDYMVGPRIEDSPELFNSCGLSVVFIKR